MANWIYIAPGSGGQEDENPEGEESQNIDKESELLDTDDQALQSATPSTPHELLSSPLESPVDTHDPYGKVY